MRQATDTKWDLLSLSAVVDEDDPIGLLFPKMLVVCLFMFVLRLYSL